MSTRNDSSDLPVTVSATTAPVALEKRGRRWLLWSFLLCPCHLPITLGLVAIVLGGTAFGTMISDNAVAAGLIVSAVWAYGTARGLRYIHKADRGELVCEVDGRRTLRSFVWP